MSGRSAVIIPLSLPRRLAAVRIAVDPAAAHRIPPHVTVLFPFVPTGDLAAGVRARLARIAAQTRPFAVHLERIEQVDAMVWLVPEEQRIFLRLTAAVAAGWPDYPPYGGVHDKLIAHVTLVESADDAVRVAVRAIAARVGPFAAPAREMRVITEDEAGMWRTRWRLPLGTASPGRAT